MMNVYLELVDNPIYHGSAMQTTRELVGGYLRAHVGAFVSGQELSDSLGVSRSAVWKAVEALRDDGLTIEARTNRGYRLIEDGQLSPSELKQLLPECDVHFHEAIDSTNREAKALAAALCPEGTLCIARKQEGGRGRLGRSFSSPHGGIYLSLVLRPQAKTEAALMITAASAVATALAIEETTGIHCGIKWVNDLYKDGRKVTGILTEGVMDMDSGRLSAVVVGIGINFCTQKSDFPEEIQQTAGSLYAGPSQVPSGVSQNELVARLVRHLLEFSRKLPQAVFLPEYRARNMLMGQEVVTIRGGRVQGRGVVTGIDDQARLLLRHSDGSEEVVGTGEVSVRLSCGSTSNPL